MNSPIAIVGIGKLGLCFALNLERAGYDIIAYDIRKEYLESLRKKTFVSKEAGVNDLLQNSSNITYTDQIEEILNASLVFILVATPSLATGDYDHSQIDNFFDQIYPLLKEGGSRIDFVIGATVMPGYSQKLTQRLNLKSHFISYNPEFIAQGTVVNDQLYPDIVLIGQADEKAGNKIKEVYEKLTLNEPSHHLMTATEAEITKISLNCFITTKISFANFIGNVAYKTGADPTVILNAIGADSRVGNSYLKWGYGYGGPCFPRDNRALSFFSRKMEIEPHIPGATDATNQDHAGHYADHIQSKIEDNTLILSSVSYKKGTGIIEESQILKTAEVLAKRGVIVIIEESPEIIDEVRAIYGNIFQYRALG